MCVCSYVRVRNFEKRDLVEFNNGRSEARNVSRLLQFPVFSDSSMIYD